MDIMATNKYPCKNCDHRVIQNMIGDSKIWQHDYYVIESNVKILKVHHMYCTCKKAEPLMDALLIAISFNSIANDDDTIKDHYAPMVIEELIHQGHKVFILSDEDATYNPEIKEFLKFYEFPPLTIGNQPLTRDNPAKRLHGEFDLIVDTSPELFHASRIVNSNNRAVILYSDPINNHVGTTNFRANNWNDVKGIIDEITEWKKASLPLIR